VGADSQRIGSCSLGLDEDAERRGPSKVPVARLTIGILNRGRNMSDADAPRGKARWGVELQRPPEGLAIDSTMATPVVIVEIERTPMVRHIRNHRRAGSRRKSRR